MKFLAPRLKLLLILITSFSTGCKKFVIVDNPTNQLVTPSVFSDNSTATAAQLAVYAQMYFNADIYSITKQQGLSSDEQINYSKSGTQFDLYTNSLSASDATIGIWSNAYKYIYEENAILEGLSNSNSLSASIKLQLAGEAKFVRAFWYFNLVNFYGSVPLILTTDFKANATASRTQPTSVYKQIISDLTDAKNLLNTNYVDASDTTISVDRVRPTKWVVTALLSKAYLYDGDYQDAEAQASLLINNTTTFALVSDLNKVFRKNSPEAIWQLMPASTNTNFTWEGYYYLLSIPPTNTNNTSLSIQVINAFQPGDLRYANWVGSLTSGLTTYYYPDKYKAGNSSSSQTEYSMVFRLAEQYLIRAEALAVQNKLPDAVADLNTIRSRANLPKLNSSLSQTQVLAAVFQERIVELFSEGHRWFDLKRTNSVDTTMTIATSLKGGSWKSYQQYYPVPETDILNDINLIQTQGY